MKILNKLSLFLTVLMSLFVLTPSLALADCSTCSDSAQKAIQCGANSAASGSCSAQPTSSLDGTIKSIINVLSVVVGVVAVIMIIIAGFRYVTSGGKQESVTSAKNTLVYAIIGLIIVALAQVIARFVLTNVTKK